MVFLLFFIAAFVTVLTAVKLSTYADIISSKTAIGGLLIGSMLLAGATSLPEITTSYTSIVLDNPNLAVGSILGSNLFNLVILAGLDIYFRRQHIFEKIWVQHRYTAGIGLALSLIILFSLQTNLMYIVLGVGIDTFIIFGGYLVGMIILSNLKQTPKNKEAEDTKKDASPGFTARKAMFRFIIASIIIMTSGSILTISGDQIAIITGLGSSFVGSFLIAASTSLPEAVSCFVACKLKNFNLAIGSILGSNLFNILILCGTDIFYRSGPLLVDVGPIHELTTSLVIFLYVVTFYLLIRVKARTSFQYSFPSLLILFSYIAASYYIFIF